MDRDRLFGIVADVSSITHGHVRSIISCSACVEMAVSLLQGLPPPERAYAEMKRAVADFYKDEAEPRYLYNVIVKDISAFRKEEIRSSGYAVHTLEASL